MAAIVRKYLTDTFLRSYETTVTSIEQDAKGWLVKLQDTIFHPKGGGQQDDQGTINGLNVTAVIKAEGNEINHYIESDGRPDLEIGQKVALKINPERRLQNATSHSAGHVLAALTEARYPQLKAFQAHHYPGEARVKFRQQEGAAAALPNYDTISASLTGDMLKAITEGLAIITLQIGEDRAIQIGDSAPVGCGGTHLSNANQIKTFAIRSIKAKKGEYTIGYNTTVREDLVMHEQQDAAEAGRA